MADPRLMARAEQRARRLALFCKCRSRGDAEGAGELGLEVQRPVLGSADAATSEAPPPLLDRPAAGDSGCPPSWPRRPHLTVPQRKAQPGSSARLAVRSW